MTFGLEPVLFLLFLDTPTLCPPLLGTQTTMLVMYLKTLKFTILKNE